MLLLACGLLFLFFAQAAIAAPEASADGQASVTPQMLHAKIQSVEQSSDLADNVKNKLLDFYRQSVGNLESAAANNALADTFMQSIETAPLEAKRIRAQVGQPDRQAKEPETPEGATVKDLEQQLLMAKARFAAIEAKTTTLSSQLAAQNERPKKAGQRLTEVKKSEEELFAALKSPPPADELPQMTEARQWMLQTQLLALQSETKMLNQELVSMPVLLELAEAQRAEAADQLDRARALTQRLEAKVNQKRQAEAAATMEQAEEALRLVADRPLLLQQAASENAALGDELRSSTADLESAAQEKETLGSTLKFLEENLRNARQKIELAGMSQALGFVLREQQRQLPDVRVLKKKAAANEENIAETGLRLVQHEEEQKRLRDVDAYVAEFVAGSPPEEAAKIAVELRGLFGSRQELLGKIVTVNQSALGLLAELDVTYSQVFNAVESFDAFLAKHLLWMRSTPPLRLKDLAGMPRELAVLLAPKPWLSAGAELAGQAGSSPLPVVVCLAAAVLLWNAKRLRAQLELWTRLASNPATYGFGLTIGIVGLTLLIALPWPLLLLTLGWHMQSLAEGTAYSRAVGTGLLSLSYRFYLLQSLRMLLLPQGLAAGCFHWSKTTVRLLRHETKWLLATFLPAAFITQAAFAAGNHLGGGIAFARMAFLLVLATLAISFYRIFHPKTGVWHGYLHDLAHRTLTRVYPLFFILLLSIFCFLGGLILRGFINSAGMLMSRFIDTLWLVLGLIVCHQLIEQWLIQSGRKLAIQKAVNIRAATPAPGSDPQSAGPGVQAEPAVDFNSLSAESSKLLDTLLAVVGFFGVWMVWSDVLPAFRVLDQFTLWTYSVVIDGETRQAPVTLANASLAALIGVIALAASRRFPSLLEFVLLRHLDMTPGGRYTATTLSRYLIGGIGLLLVADIFGFSWGQIQWLVAALGVGIGFGLQEIVANFISGLIILFERPIRVGDVVTVGNTDGVVTRIRIRATTIRDYDRKELLVPNKEFISGRLLNWSLSDPVTRILSPVGLAYGSDVQLAMALMVEAAQENPKILAEPKPVATFDGFGDNALLLTLRCFIGSVEFRVPAKSDLHKAIDRKFREAGLSMAFPQLDVHFDVNRPLEVRICPDPEADSSVVVK
jgi:potassium efflux system protein